jgi:hypothetical protein
MSAVQSRVTQEEIQWLIDNGEYPDSQAVISKAVHVLYEYTSKMTALRAGLDASIEQANHGQLTRWTREASEKLGREVEEAYARGELDDVNLDE